MGLPMYGQAFSIADRTNTGLNSKASGKGQAGQFTRAAGFLAYYEVRIIYRYILLSLYKRAKAVFSLYKDLAKDQNASIL